MDIIEYSDPLLVDYYNIKISLDYKDIDLTTEGESTKLTGNFGLIISNEGVGSSECVGSTGVGTAPNCVKIKVT